MPAIPTIALLFMRFIFKANPRIKRVVFICTPHRGSEMASGGIGRLAISLISLPLNVATVLKDAVTQAELTQITGSKRLPNSVYGLQPNNPTFKVAKQRSHYRSLPFDYRRPRQRRLAKQHGWSSAVLEFASRRGTI